MPDRDGYTRVSRPYPSDRPDLVTLWNPACQCSHAQHVHDYAGDEQVTGWGHCEIEGCECESFEEAE